MNALSQLEFLLEAGFAALAVAVASWSAVRALTRRAGSPATGEIVWAAVALAVLAGVGAAVAVGSGHGV